MPTNSSIILEHPLRYGITFDPVAYVVESADGRRGFRAPASSKCPKLYVFSRSGHLIYIGQTVQAMGTRLRQGMTASGESGYHGYAWRHDRQSVDLDVWVVSASNGCCVDPKELESIECEVVHAYRSRHGQWPLHQTEIHFRQIQPIHTHLAKVIMDHYSGERKDQ